MMIRGAVNGAFLPGSGRSRAAEGAGRAEARAEGNRDAVRVTLMLHTS